MSKNLTRKGLAFGALVALGSTAIAGTPAFALDPLALSPSSGTSYNTILGESLVVQSLFTDAQQQGAENLKFRIVDSTKKLDLAASGWDTATATTDRTVNTAADDAAGTNLTANDGTYVVTAGSTVGPSKNFLVLKADSAATATFSVTVQSWMDFDNDNITDSDEAASAVQTVKFVKASEVTSTTTIAAVTEGDTTISATLAFNDINNEQLTAANVGVYFTKGDGSSLKDTDGTTDLANTSTKILKSGVTWSATDKFKFTTDTIGALAKSTAVKVQPVFELSGPEFDDKIGTAATLDVATRKASLATASVVRGATAATISSSNQVARNKSFQVKLAAKDTATTPVALAGLAVTAKIEVGVSGSAVSLGTGTSDKTLTVNGTKYTANSALPGATGVAQVALTTDAKGEAFVTLESANFVVGDHIKVTFTYENRTSAVEVVSVDPSYTGYVANLNGDKFSTVDGTAVAVQVVVRDQFGTAIGTGYKAQAIWDATGSYSAQSTTASTDATATSADIVDGKATLNIVDNGTGTGVHNYDIKFAKVLSNGGLDTPVVVLNDLKIAIVSSVTAGAVKLTATDGGTALGKNTAETAYVIGTGVAGASDNKVALQTATDVAFGNYDSRANSGTAPTVTSGSKAVVYGSVTTASSATVAAAAIANGQVTVSGAGLQFEVAYGSDAVWGKDTLTFNAEADGTFTLHVYGQKAGVQTVTFTSGAATSKLELSFAAAAETAGASVALTAPATIEPGKTITVTGVLADKFGNAVDTNQGQNDVRSGASTFSVAYDGPGLIVGDLPAKTDADGKFTFRVLLGASDTGSATVTVKYDADGSSTTTTDAVTKTASIAIAAPVVVVPEVKTTIVGVTKAVRIRVENAKGEEVEVKFGSKTVAVAIAGTNSKLWVLKTTKGKKSVKVYVDGDLVAVKTVTVK